MASGDGDPFRGMPDGLTVPGSACRGASWPCERVASTPRSTTKKRREQSVARGGLWHAVRGSPRLSRGAVGSVCVVAKCAPGVERITLLFYIKTAHSGRDNVQTAPKRRHLRLSFTLGVHKMPLICVKLATGPSYMHNYRPCLALRPY